MKLQTIETHIVKTPPPGFGGRYFIFVVLQTACGIRGYGEIYAASFAPETVLTMATDVFGRYLEDQNPFEIERFWRRAHGSGFSHRPDPSMQGVVSGLEMACWDIVGKALDRPVYDLLGGKVNDRLRTYTYLYPRADQDAASFYNDASASAGLHDDLMTVSDIFADRARGKANTIFMNFDFARDANAHDFCS